MWINKTARDWATWLIYGVDFPIVIIVYDHRLGSQRKARDETIAKIQPKSVRNIRAYNDRTNNDSEAHHQAIHRTH